MSSLSLFLLCIFSLDLIPNLVFSTSSSSSIQDPEHVVQEVHSSINASRTYLGTLSCGSGNPIDDCWRCDPNWEKNRKRLADCAIGFGKKATGGKHGKIYVVNDSRNDDPVNPKPGTLRHAVIQEEPLWIIFETDMVITLKQHLVMNSYKTIDGRGANVHIAKGPCIIIREATDIIIHGIHIHGCKQGGNGYIRVSPSHYKWWGKQDGDAIAVFGGQKIWIDHCSLSNCHDGLIDATFGSTDITISNNHMTHHNKVMLLGHSDLHDDKDMKVTVAFNHFGEGLVQRMPRCRHGYIHVVNNDYVQWGKYAIGGSAAPTIYSQGNRFFAPNDTYKKEVTRRMHDVPESEWRKWNWKSEGDLMLNGAYFRQSGSGESSVYARVSSLSARSSSLVGSITKSAGALNCKKNSARC